MQKIVFTNINGGISVVTPTKEILKKRTIYDIAEKLSPYNEYKIINDNEVMNDRSFRKAWKLSNNKIIEDVSISFDIFIEDLRIKRNEILKNLDVKYLMAIEKNDKNKMEQIIQEKQKLRDLPSKFDKRQFVNIDSLKALIKNNNL